jgi:hypothetical protein
MIAALVMPGGIAGLAIWIVVLLAIAGIVGVFCRVSGVSVPGWVVQLFWILIAAVACIAAIRFVAGL